MVVLKQPTTSPHLVRDNAIAEALQYPPRRQE